MVSGLQKISVEKSDEFVAMQINIFFIHYPHCNCNLPEGITELKRLSNDPQIKSAHSEYRNQAIGIISIQLKT